VCAASSSIAAYASTSTTTPEHSAQISSVPIISRAHLSGSRLKKDPRTTLFINRALPFSLGFVRSVGFDGFGRWLVVDGKLHVTFNRLAVSEGWNEFRAAEIG